jgi:hypothetical protein
MTYIKYIQLTLVLLVGLSSCNKTIDATDEGSYKESIDAMKNSLDENQEAELEKALATIAFDAIDMSDMLNPNYDGEKVGMDLMKKLDGKSFDEIVEEGERIEIEIEKKKKEQAKIEIEELKTSKVKAESDKQNLGKFEVLKSRFYKRKKGSYYVTYEPVIEMTVKNGTDQPISRAYFTGTLSSPGRSIPWLKDDFNYEISGGLEPGEEKRWSLAPNMFSNWGKVKAPKDAIFTVDVNRIDGVDSEPIYDANQFTSDNEERLQSLLNSYPDFK